MFLRRSSARSSSVKPFCESSEACRRSCSLVQPAATSNYNRDSSDCREEKNVRLTRKEHTQFPNSDSELKGSTRGQKIGTRIPPQLPFPLLLGFFAGVIFHVFSFPNSDSELKGSNSGSKDRTQNPLQGGSGTPAGKTGTLVFGHPYHTFEPYPPKT